MTLDARNMHAYACLDLGRIEASQLFADLLNTATRVLGKDHPLTQNINSRHQAVQASRHQAVQAILCRRLQNHEINMLRGPPERTD